MLPWRLIKICTADKEEESQIFPEDVFPESCTCSVSGHYQTWTAWLEPATTVSREGTRMYFNIWLLNRRGRVLEAVWFRLRQQSTKIIFQVPASFRGPRISHVSSMAQTVFARVSITPLDEFVGTSDEQTLRRRVCSLKTDQAIVDWLDRGSGR